MCLSSLTLPDTKMRFTKCVVGPSFLLRDEVYQVHSGPLIPPERWGLSMVQWAPHPWLCFKDNPVFSGLLIPNLSWKMRFTQCATSPSSLLIDEIYQMCSGPLIPDSASKITQCAVGSSSLTCPERWGLPSVQPAPHPSWEMRFT